MKNLHKVLNYATQKSEIKFFHLTNGTKKINSTKPYTVSINIFSTRLNIATPKIKITIAAKVA